MRRDETDAAHETAAIWADSEGFLGICVGSGSDVVDGWASSEG